MREILPIRSVTKSGACSKSKNRVEFALLCCVYYVYYVQHSNHRHSPMRSRWCGSVPDMWPHSHKSQATHCQQRRPDRITHNFGWYGLGPVLLCPSKCDNIPKISSYEGCSPRLAQNVQPIVQGLQQKTDVKRKEKGKGSYE